ncbi:MAG: Hpt domain-containing protein [Thermoanaerobaculales bacterium]
MKFEARRFHFGSRFAADEPPSNLGDRLEAAPDVAGGGAESSADRELCAYLRSIGIELGPNTLKELIDIFLRDTCGRLDALATALDNGDQEALAKGAHYVKGSAATIRAKTLATLCEQLEELAKFGPLADADTLLERIGQEAARLRLTLDAERKRITG